MFEGVLSVFTKWLGGAYQSLMVTGALVGAYRIRPQVPGHRTIVRPLSGRFEGVFDTPLQTPSFGSKKRFWSNPCRVFGSKRVFGQILGGNHNQDAFLLLSEAKIITKIRFCYYPRLILGFPTPGWRNPRLGLEQKRILAPRRPSFWAFRHPDAPRRGSFIMPASLLLATRRTSLAAA